MNAHIWVMKPRHANSGDRMERVVRSFPIANLEAGPPLSTGDLISADHGTYLIEAAEWNTVGEVPDPKTGTFPVEIDYWVVPERAASRTTAEIWVVQPAQPGQVPPGDPEVVEQLTSRDVTDLPPLTRGDVIAHEGKRYPVQRVEWELVEDDDDVVVHYVVGQPLPPKRGQVTPG